MYELNNTVLLHLSVQSYKVLAMFTATQIILCIGSIIANGLNLICFMKFKYRQKIENIFICSLSIADLGTAVCELAAACWAYREWPTGKCDIKVDTCLSYINYTLMVFSIACVYAISIERFGAIVFPLKYNIYFSKKRLICLECIICFSMIVYVYIMLGAFDDKTLHSCFGNRSGYNTCIAVTIAHICGLLFLSTIYGVVFYVANRQKAKINSVVPFKENTKSSIVNFKALRFVICVLLTYLLLYSPFALTIVVYLYSPQWVPTVMIIGVHSTLLNGIINVIIYAIFTQPMRTAYKELFICEKKHG